MNTGWRDIDIHGSYSLVKIAFAPTCACNDNRQIWRHNTSISRSHDVTDQLWWRHNARSEKAALGNNGEMSARRSMIVLSGFACSWHKIACKKWNNTFVTVNNNFLSLVRRFGNDFHSWWFSLVTSSLVKIIAESPHSWQKIVIHGNSCIILYVLHMQYLGWGSPDDTRSQGISSRGIDLVIAEYSGSAPEGSLVIDGGCGCWCPGTQAPGHQHPQCWLLCHTSFVRNDDYLWDWFPNYALGTSNKILRKKWRHHYWHKG